MNYKQLMVIALLCATGMQARTAITHRTRARAAGHISGKVEIILQTMSFTVEQKKAMLEVELRNMYSLGLDKTEPALLKKIEAHLGLAKVRQARLEKLKQEPVAAKEEPLIDVVETKEEKPTTDPINDITAYAQKVIADAAAYADHIDMPGMPSVSQQRELTVVERRRAMAQNPDMQAYFARVNGIHKKVVALAQASKVLTTFIDSFSNHLVQKYAAHKDGMHNEVYFRAYELLADALPSDQRAVADVVGPFLNKYNTYVAPSYRLTAEALAVPHAQWPELIMSTDQAQAHVMLLLSVAMEQVKIAAKRSAAQVQQKQMLVEKTGEAVHHLRAASVRVEKGHENEPMYVAMACGTQVENLVSQAGSPAKMSPEQREQAELFARLAEQLNQLATDYEVVVQQQAGSAANRRHQNDIAALPQQQQEVLMNNPTGEQLAVMMGMDGMPMGADGMPLPMIQNKGMSPMVPVIIATGIGVAWEVLGNVAESKMKKAEKSGEQAGAFWRMIAPIGTPSGGASAAFNKIKGLFGKKEETKEEKKAAAPAATTTSTSSPPSKAGSAPATPPVPPAQPEVTTTDTSDGAGATPPPPAFEGSEPASPHSVRY